METPVSTKNLGMAGGPELRREGEVFGHEERWVGSQLKSPACTDEGHLRQEWGSFWNC